MKREVLSFVIDWDSDDDQIVKPTKATADRLIALANGGYATGGLVALLDMLADLEYIACVLDQAATYRESDAMPATEAGAVAAANLEALAKNGWRLPAHMHVDGDDAAVSALSGLDAGRGK